MKKIFILLSLVLIIPGVLAALEIEEQSSDNVLIVGVDKPATFNLRIKNTGAPDSFEFYNFAGFSMFPKGTVYISEGQTKPVKLEIYQIGELNQRGPFTFQYFIKGENTSEVSTQLTTKIIELGEAFEIGSGEIDPDLNSLKIYIENKENFDFENINAEFSSAFFTIEENFTLEAYKTKEFAIELNKEDFRELKAGFYTLNAGVSFWEQDTEIEGVIKFVEKDFVTTSKKEYGVLITTNIIEKINEGNVVSKSETVIKKNVLSRLFTSFSPEPDIVERQGGYVFYTWVRELKPSESIEIVIKTNWLFPLIAVFFIVAIVVLAKTYSGSHMVLRKRVSFVRTKGGEFALKVSISAHAKKYIERVNIIDRIPPLVKIHEKFGVEQPSKVNEKARRIEWDYEKLERGETRVISYIIYSKVGILGKFALPTATAIYEKEGKIHETESNRTFFISEQRTSRDEDSE